MTRSFLQRYVPPVTLTFVAMALRLYDLEGQSLWQDEGVTYAWASLPFGTVVSHLLLLATQTPLYFTLVRVVLTVAGTSTFALRLASAWTSTLTIPVAYVAGGRVLDRRTGLLASSLLALNPFHIWYGQEARMYALSMLLSAGVLMAFMRALHRPGWGPWLILACTSGVAYVVHWFTLTLAAAQILVILVDFRVLYLRFRRWFAAQALAALPATAWALAALAKRHTTRLGPDWIPRPHVLSPLYTLFNFSLGYDPSPSPWLLAGWFLFLAAFGLAFRSSVEQRWRRTLLAWMAVPIGATYLISLHRPIYVDRYISVALPPFILWTALGITSLPRHWRPVAAGLLLSASALAAVGTLSGARFRKEDWRSAASHVSEASRPGDRLFVINPEDIPVARYYLGDDVPLTVGLPDPPPEGGSWFLYRIPAESNHELGEPKGASFQRDADPKALRWLVTHNHQIVKRRSYAGLELFLIDGGVEP